MRVIGALIFGFFLTACALEPGQATPDLNFSQIQATSLMVRDIEVVPAPEYMMAQMPAGFVIDPAKAVYDFFKGRYKSEGAQGQFKISITNVSIVHDMKESDGAVRAYLNVDKQDKYEIRVVMRLETFGVDGYEKQKVDVSARQSLSISEHVSLAKRESAQIEAVKDLIDRLEQETARAISETFRI